MAEKKAYTQAVRTGLYYKPPGLLGKYDNVRRFWEDQVTGIFLRPALNDLAERKKQRLQRVRILDLGCGSGDGYDLLMGVATKDPGIYEHITNAITEDMLREYVGVDINEDLLEQARANYGRFPKTRFLQGDLSECLPPSILEEEPFDIYFTSYGTLSHFHDDQNVKLISGICKHAPQRALFIGDWLGRYSYEWRDLWHHPADEEYFMDYRISYFITDDEEEKNDVPIFPLRLITRDEIMQIVNRAAEESGVEIRPVAFFDRSLLIGRHMETGDYNNNCPKLRTAVNSLFEPYLRTDLESLLVDCVPRPGFDHLNNFFEMFFLCCNTLVRHTISLLNTYSSEQESESPFDVLPFFPDPLKEAMHTMRRIIEGVGWLKWGDARANIIEPHLGFSLRKLEMDLQPGTGMGHGLVGIFEIRK